MRCVYGVEVDGDSESVRRRDKMSDLYRSDHGSATTALYPQVLSQLSPGVEQRQSAGRHTNLSAV